MQSVTKTVGILTNSITFRQSSQCECDNSTDVNNKTEETEHLIQKDGVRDTKSEYIRTRQVMVMLACFVNHIIVVGFNNALGVIYVELIRAFDSPRSEAALVQSLYTGITTSGGILVSGVVYKQGPGICISLGMVFSAVALFVSSFSINIYMMIVFVGIFCAVGTGITFMCDFIAVSWAFKTNRRSALAFVTVGSTVGQVSFPYLAEIMLERYFWNGTMMLFSGVFLHSLLTGLMVHISRQILYDDVNSNDTSSKKQSYARIFKTCNMLFVLIVIFVMDIGASMAYYFTVDLTEMRGYEREDGASLLSIFGVSSLVGRVSGTAFLAFCINIRATSHYIHSLTFFGVGNFLVIYSKEYLGMLVGIMFQGLANGLTMSMLPGLLIEQFGVDYFPVALASTNVISGLYDIAFGFLGGLIADVTGGYSLLYYIAVGSSGVGAGITLVIVMFANFRVSKQ